MDTKTILKNVRLPSFIENPNPNLYLTQERLALDWETTNLDKGDARNPGNRIVLGSVLLSSNERLACRPDSLDRLFSLLDGRILLAHNAKFELAWLRRLGYPIETLLVFDTMMAEKVLAGNRLWPLDLDSLSQKYGGTQKNRLISALMKTGVCPSEMPRELLQSYCDEDCSNTELIFQKQMVELQQLNLLPVVYTRCLLLPVLVDIEAAGMQLDEKRVADEYNRTQADYTRVADALTGFMRGANPNSTKQLAAFLYDVLGFEEVRRYDGQPERTPGGARKTDKPTLARLRARTKEQEQVLGLIKEQAKLDTKLNNYLTKFRRACEEDGGLLKGDISQVIPRTHRLSSQGGRHRVQFHNMDRLLKRMIRSRYDGWDVGEADQAQLEFRVATYLTQDPQGMDDIAHKVDVHAITRDYLEAHGQKFETKDRKDMRTESKPMTFRPVYGGTSGTPAEQAYCKFFNEKYHVMHKEQSKWEMEVLKSKFLRTITGLRFYWPEIRLRRNGKTTEHSAIFNYPVQYFATGEIVPISLVYAWHYFKALGLKAFLINTVHDSVVWENPPEERKIISEICQRTGTSCVVDYLKRVYGISMNVPLDVEISYSKHWADKEEAIHVS